MSITHAVPQLLIVMVALALGLIFWGFWRYLGDQMEGIRIVKRDDVLIVFLIFVAFVYGVLIAYLMFSFVS